jgi:hypothetical protein
MSAIYEDRNCCLLVAPRQRGQMPSLFGIKKRHTQTGRTELHIRSPESNYQHYSLNVGTGLHETDRNFTFLMADWTGDGLPDLWAIKKWATGSGRTEVHIYSAASNYAEAVFHGATALHETGDTYDFEVRARGADAPPDLVAISRSRTGTSTTELHVLSGSQAFQQFSLQTGTGLHETGAGPEWKFLMTDWDLNGTVDLAVASPENGGEIHILRGPQYQQFLMQSIISQANERQLLAENDALYDAFQNCAAAVGSFLVVLGTAATTPGSILLFAGTRVLLLASMTACVRDVNRYNRIRQTNAGQGGSGDHNDRPFPGDRPHPTPPTRPPAPVDPPEPPPTPDPAPDPSDPADPGAPPDPDFPIS